jgi:hypothetical protein
MYGILHKLVVIQCISYLYNSKGSFWCSPDSFTGTYLQPDEPIHTLTTYSLMIYFNITLLSMPRSPKLSLPLLLDDQNQVRVSFTHVACHLNIPDFKDARRGI